jgi:predicted TIM-barrel fold metal-dependent hydrolase
LADTPGNSGMPQGIVAYADLSAHDVGDLFAAHAKHPNMRGTRQILNVRPDPLYDYTGRHFMREPTWLSGLALLHSHGAIVRPADLPGANAPNVAVKISGLGMLDHRWTVECLRPLVLETIDAFGTERSMFASNFPVDRLYRDYATLWRAFEAIVHGASEAEKAAPFGGTPSGSTASEASPSRIWASSR